MAPCGIVRRVLGVEARVGTNNTRKQTLVGLSIDHWMITGADTGFYEERQPKAADNGRALNPMLIATSVTRRLPYSALRRMSPSLEGNDSGLNLLHRGPCTLTPGCGGFVWMLSKGDAPSYRPEHRNRTYSRQRLSSACVRGTEDITGMA